MDIAGSLAYFTILSLFPLVTLLIMALSIFTDPVVMQGKLADTLVYFFPASRELLQNAMIHLFSGSLALGLIVLAGIVVSSNGLFMAANRSVNRVFGLETRKPVGTMTTEVVVGTVLLVLFVFSVGFTTLFRFATSVGGTSAVWVFSSRAVSEAMSAGLTSGLLDAAGAAGEEVLASVREAMPLQLTQLEPASEHDGGQFNASA